MSPEQARAEAVRAFGDVDAVRREMERMTRARHGRTSRAEWVSDLAQDVRYGVRGMRRGWAFALVTLLTLALGIGATTATFSVVNGVLLRPLDYPNADRLIRVWERTNGGDRAQLATPNLFDLKERSRTLSSLAGYLGGTTVVLGANEPTRALANGVTRDFFAVFGVKPMLGRLFVPDEVLENGPRSVIVSHAFWQRYLGATRDIERRSLDLYGTRYQVVGVMPPALHIPLRRRSGWRASSAPANRGRRTTGRPSADSRLTPRSSARAASSTRSSGRWRRSTAPTWTRKG
jgi:hypothetical protein